MSYPLKKIKSFAVILRDCLLIMVDFLQVDFDTLPVDKSL